MFSVYKATSPSNKVYFGITNNFPKRKSGHYTKAKKIDTFFANALRKYGNKMIWEVHTEVETWEEACELEQFLIAGFASCNPKYGYNQTLGGEGSFGGKGPTGYKHTLEAKAKMSAAKKGKQPWLGKKHTTESIAKIKRNRPVGHIAHTTKHSEESKIKMSIAKKAGWARRKNHVIITQEPG